MTQIKEPFIEKLINFVLNSKKMPSLDYIQSKAWLVLPVADSLNAMEAEWLSDAVNLLYKSDDMIGVSFEFNNNFSMDKVKVERDCLLEYNSKFSHRYICLTNQNFDFLYYKDQASRFFLLCGIQDFLSQAYRCSSDTARIIYFDWLEDDFNSNEEKAFLENIWSSYT